jgi:hypothetical protein
MQGGKKSTDKGKPGESRRRKAMGLTSQCDYDRQVAEVNKERLFVIIRLDNVRQFLSEFLLLPCRSLIYTVSQPWEAVCFYFLYCSLRRPLCNILEGDGASVTK